MYPSSEKNGSEARSGMLREAGVRVSTDKDVGDKPPWMDSRRPSHQPPSAHRFWLGHRVSVSKNVSFLIIM